MIHLSVAIGGPLLILIGAQNFMRCSPLSWDHNFLILHFGANTAHVTLWEMCWLEVVLQAAQRLAHRLFVLLTSLQIFGCSLRTFTLSIAIRIRITLTTPWLVHKAIRLVVFPSIHHNLVLLMSLACEITVFYIIHTSELMLNILIWYFSPLR